MPRRPREDAPGAIHHIVPQGTGRRRIVEDDRDRTAFVSRFAEVQRDLGWFVHSSCLLDTHYHAVVETPEANLGQGMRSILGGHSRWLNARHGRTETVFVPHFWSRRLADEAWLFRACLYTVLNPVVAGLCSHPREWRWCSYRSTAEGDPAAFAPGEERLLRMFGNTPAEARATYAKLVDDTVARILAERTRPTEFWESLRQVEPRRATRVSD